MVAAERFFDGKYDYILDLPDDEDDGEDDDAGPSSKAKSKVHTRTGGNGSFFTAADTRPRRAIQTMKMRMRRCKTRRTTVGDSLTNGGCFLAIGALTPARVFMQMYVTTAYIISKISCEFYMLLPGCGSLRRL